MVATFLQAEIDSSVWGDRIRQLLPSFQLTESMVRNPNLSDPDQNSRRSAILGVYRGWRQDKWLFANWPDGVEWWFVALDKADLANGCLHVIIARAQFNPIAAFHCSTSKMSPSSIACSSLEQSPSVVPK